MGRWSLHPGWNVVKKLVSSEEEVEEEVDVFNPEAAATDGNPFPEELMVEAPTEEVEEEVVEETPDYESMTVKQLRAILEERGLTVRGTKAELIARLDADDAGPSEEAPDESTEAPLEEAASSEEDAQEGDVSESGEQQEDS